MNPDEHMSSAVTGRSPRRPSLSKAWVPSVLVVAPLAGLAFVSDERRQIYLRTLTDDANPIETAFDAARGIDGFLAHGNFRPIGRFWEMLIHGFVYEVGEATAISPHTVLGIMSLRLFLGFGLLGSAGFMLGGGRGLRSWRSW